MRPDAARTGGGFDLPDPSLLLLVGPAGCGKSRFAARHFAPKDVLSSDTCRELVAGDPGDQAATPDAFGVLRTILDRRCKRRRLTVLDATNVVRRDRARALGIARRYDLPAVAIVLDLPLETCQAWATARTERPVPADVVAQQHASLRRHLDSLPDEGFDDVVVLGSVDEIDGFVPRRVPTPAPEDLPGRVGPRGDGARPPAVIIDLDGTLTSSKWRVHHISGGRRDWPRFFAGMGRDAPVPALVDLVTWVAHHAAVVLLTGRPDDHEVAIRRWLADHDIPYDLLLMRASGDRRQDTVVKRQRYREEVAPHYDVRWVVDDRPQVIEMWRDEGLYVLTAVDPGLEPLPEPTGGPTAALRSRPRR
jgi:predicted kinase